jgi:uncharacterized protein YfaS (alpha-2-macroglobulin family)
MSIDVYSAGATVQIWAHNKTWEGVPLDPSEGAKVTVTDHNGVVKITNQPMNIDSEGEYVYPYTIPSDGVKGYWHYKVTGQDGLGGGAEIVIKEGSFRVK